MLVIARREQESFIIPSIQATIRVVAIRSGSVRIGIEAPPDIAVYREELYERLSAEADGPCAAAPVDPVGQKHQVHNHLNDIARALAMLQRQLGDQATPAAQVLLDRTANACATLRLQLNSLLDSTTADTATAACALKGAGI
jgi:carbon storage regulator CsrA